MAFYNLFYDFPILRRQANIGQLIQAFLGHRVAGLKNNQRHYNGDGRVQPRQAGNLNQHQADKYPGRSPYVRLQMQGIRF